MTPKPNYGIYQRNQRKISPGKDSLLAVLGESARSRNLTAEKTSICMERDGSQVTGFVVTDKNGGVGIIDKSACRWLEPDEMWWLMHDSAQIGNNLKANALSELPTERK